MLFLIFAGTAKNTNKDQIVAIAKNLIRYKSFTGMEKDIGHYVCDFFHNIGVEYQVVEKEKGGPNIIATLGSGEKTIAFNGHVDTVPLSDESLWETDPFMPEVKKPRPKVGASSKEKA